MSKIYYLKIYVAVQGLLSHHTSPVHTQSTTAVRSVRVPGWIACPIPLSDCVWYIFKMVSSSFQYFQTKSSIRRVVCCPLEDDLAFRTDRIMCIICPYIEHTRCRIGSIMENDGKNVSFHAPLRQHGTINLLN